MSRAAAAPTSPPNAELRNRPKPRARDLVEGELDLVEGEADDVEPPAHLAGDSLEVWRSYAPALTRAGLLTPRYAQHFAVYCTATAAADRASVELEREGPVITAPNGRRMANPAGAELSRASEIMRKYGWEFGLTPSALTALEARRAGARGGDADGGRYLT